MNAIAAAISASTDKVIAEKARGIGYLRLNQPEKHNAISYAMWLAIAEVMEAFRDDDDVRVVVMSGEGGRAFSAGADISEFSRVRSTEAQIEVYEAAGRAAYEAVTHFPKPVIARIEGSGTSQGAMGAMQSISVFNCGKTNIQTIQSNSSCIEMSLSTTNLIGQYGFSFFCKGTSSLKLKSVPIRQKSNVLRPGFIASDVLYDT